MTKFAAVGQLLLVLGCIGYSTYALFLGDFEQALLPFPILILYYLFFARKKAKEESRAAEEEKSEETGV